MFDRVLNTGLCFVFLFQKQECMIGISRVGFDFSLMLQLFSNIVLEVFYYNDG